MDHTIHSFFNISELTRVIFCQHFSIRTDVRTLWYYLEDISSHFRVFTAFGFQQKSVRQLGRPKERKGRGRRRGVIKALVVLHIAGGCPSDWLCLAT